MKVLITSGGTREYIDDVRVVTNISTGKLGAQIAERYLRGGHQVIYVSSKHAVKPNTYAMGGLTLVEGDNVQEVHDILEQYTPDVDVVIHSMAISDFTFDRANPVKLRSDDLEGFIEHMRRNIKKAPKILPKLKEWNPDVKVVGFKFEVGQTKDDLLAIARNQMEKCNTDYVFANDKKMIQEANSHVGWILSKNGAVEAVDCESKEDIANKLYYTIGT